MGTLQPQGEKLRKAVQWVSEERKKNAGSTMSLVDQAGIQFDLTPEDSEFLSRFFKASQD